MLFGLIWRAADTLLHQVCKLDLARKLMFEYISSAYNPRDIFKLFFGAEERYLLASHGYERSRDFAVHLVRRRWSRFARHC